MPLAASLWVLLAACAVVLDGSIVTLLGSTGGLTAFSSLLGKYPDLVTSIDSATKVTVLAPTDAAFAKLPVGVRAYIQQDRDVGWRFVRMHMITEAAVTRKIVEDNNGAGGVSSFTNDHSTLISMFVANRTLSFLPHKSLTDVAVPAENEITLPNGVLQVLSGILQYTDLALPTKALADLMPTYFSALLGTAGFTPPSGSTVFVPSNAAFQKIRGITDVQQVRTWPIGIAGSVSRYATSSTYLSSSALRALPGVTRPYPTNDINGNQITFEFDTTQQKIFVDAVAQVTETIPATDGILHSVTVVLAPSGVTLPINRLMDTGVFSTLFRQAVMLGGMDVSMQQGNITVFPPTDAGFAAIGVNGVSDLRSYSYEELQRMVKNAIVKGSWTKDEVRLELTRTGGSEVTLTTLDGEMTLTLNAAMEVKYNDVSGKVTRTLACTDGLIHFVDALLLPKGIHPLRRTLEGDSNLTLMEIILIAGLGAAVLIGGMYVLYSGTITSYLRKRKDELHEQEERIRREAVRDEENQRAMGRDHGGFKSLREMEEDDKLERTASIRVAPPPAVSAGGGDRSGGNGSGGSAKRGSLETELLIEEAASESESAAVSSSFNLAATNGGLSQQPRPRARGRGGDGGGGGGGGGGGATSVVQYSPSSLAELTLVGTGDGPVKTGDGQRGSPHNLNLTQTSSRYSTHSYRAELVVGSGSGEHDSSESRFSTATPAMGLSPPSTFGRGRAGRSPMMSGGRSPVSTPLSPPAMSQTPSSMAPAMKSDLW